MSTDRKNIIELSKYKLRGLGIYRNLLSDPVIAAYRSLLDMAAKQPPVAADCFIDHYSEFFFLLSRTDKRTDLAHYILDRILLDENTFTASAARKGEEMDTIIKSAALSDIRALRAAVSLSSSDLKSGFMDQNTEILRCQAVISSLPEWTILSDGSDAAGNSNIANSSNSASASRAADASYVGEQTPLQSVPSESLPLHALRQLWLRDESCERFLEELMAYHLANGSGIFARKYAFTWQPDNSGMPGSFAPVRNPDPVRLSDLIAYESEREEVLRNTEQFLEGFEANNVLLYGDRGTGKSSTVKALLNEYCRRGLRMVEVPKHLLTDFPEIIGQLSDKPYKFILFVDDLSFEDSEGSYTALKAVIEGGLELRPKNILIYATSNRKHLIREKFSDRLGLQYGSQEDEIRAGDTIQEKLSLSDRFGITVVFASPDKKRFLEIVDQLAQKKGLVLDPETLHKEALKWELWYNGRSPRTAQQFINYIAGGSGNGTE
jgi:predicted AAA+ superfamily ATPase